MEDRPTESDPFLFGLQVTLEYAGAGATLEESGRSGKGLGFSYLQ
jgi:hypothetical protein